ncbi:MULTISPECIES: PilW family protein [unclassified Halomonas]|uniref:PilW family protein n=1 Tax=unclassified Halomonas TaxID=2609666 RepID=UPI0009BDE823|nr:MULTISPECIES: prepilin-type N-terminal cleavage/methylation domain-containing protein [unclassified Halomonas]
MERQNGFTLTEMMVAMVVGVIIVIGAGQLFLSTLHTFRQTESLGRQQEALIFSVAHITATLQRHGAYDATGEPYYRLQCVPSASECRCTLQDMSRAQPLVTFQAAEGGSCARDEPVGTVVGQAPDVYQVVLPLGPSGQAVTFHVTHREALFHPDE